MYSIVNLIIGVILRVIANISIIATRYVQINCGFNERPLSFNFEQLNYYLAHLLIIHVCKIFVSKGSLLRMGRLENFNLIKASKESIQR